MDGTIVAVMVTRDVTLADAAAKAASTLIDHAIAIKASASSPRARTGNVRRKAQIAAGA